MDTEPPYLLLSHEASEHVAQTFRAMADPTRIRMLHALSRGELCVGDLAARVQISESAASHQLGLLRALRIVRRRKEGRHVYYALDDQHIRSLIEQGVAHQAHHGGEHLSGATPEHRQTEARNLCRNS
jgi:DNA-binding transcriptional ArsR family regulator